jgi:hypothetical protein
VPNQSIYSASGPRYSNAALAQATYLLSGRQSITASGSAGLLHFTQTGNINTDDYIVGLGYNYALTPEDSIGVAYRFMAIHYQGQPQAFGDTRVGVAYGRKVSKHLALQAFAGPEFMHYRVPVNASSGQTSGSGSASLQYGLERGTIALKLLPWAVGRGRGLHRV